MEEIDLTPFTRNIVSVTSSLAFSIPNPYFFETIRSNMINNTSKKAHQDQILANYDPLITDSKAERMEEKRLNKEPLIFTR